MIAAAEKNFNKTRIVFMERVGAPNVPPIAFKLAHLILYKYANRTTGLSYPSQTTLAADLGSSIRTVQRLLDVLERHGMMIIRGDGRGQSSRYWIDPQRVSPVSPFPCQKGDRKGRHSTSIKGDTGVTRTKERTNKTLEGSLKAPPLGMGEKNALARESDPLDRAGALDAPGRSESKESADEEEPGAEAVTEPPSERRDCAFRELVESWQRGWASDNTAKTQAITRNAFAAACMRTAPDAILAGARRWIAAADAPRYLPPLAQWLAARGWEHPPPARARRGPGGGRRNRPRKPDMLAEFYEIARQKAAEAASS
jgi:Helix-turn-helix domain